MHRLGITDTTITNNLSDIRGNGLTNPGLLSLIGSPDIDSLAHSFKFIDNRTAYADIYRYNKQTQKKTWLRCGEQRNNPGMWMIE